MRVMTYDATMVRMGYDTNTSYVRSALVDAVRWPCHTVMLITRCEMALSYAILITCHTVNSQLPVRPIVTSCCHGCQGQKLERAKTAEMDGDPPRE